MRSLADGDKRIYRSLRPQMPSAAASPVQQSEPAAGTLPTEQPGRYRIQGEQGRGGIGQVLIAYDEAVQRKVAFKQLLPSTGVPGSPGASPEALSAQTARFLREARITGGLEHPAIAPVYEIGQRADGSVYYTMKLVRGFTLADKLSLARGVGNRLTLLTHFLDLCQAIAYAHSKGVIHRDIKPANVMVGEFGETVLLDWGLAKVKGAQDEGAEKLAEELQQWKAGSTGASVLGNPIGTPSYMSPEQADGRIADIDERSDVWSLGAVLYEILTGAPPYTGSSPHDVIGSVLAKDPTPILEREPTAPPELAAIAMRCLERTPAGRYGGVRELAADVAAFQSDSFVGAFDYSFVNRLTKWFRRHRAVLITTCLGLVAMCILGSVSYFQLLKRNIQLSKRNTELICLRLIQESKAALLDHDSDLAALLAHSAALLQDPQSAWMPEIDESLRACLAEPIRHRIISDGSSVVQRIAYSPDGNYLASSGNAGVVLWSVATVPYSSKKLYDSVSLGVLGFSAAGRYLFGAAGSPASNEVLLWSAPNFDGPPLALSVEGKGISCLSFNDDENAVAVGYHQGQVEVYDIGAGNARLLTSIDVSQEQISSIQFNRNARYLIVTDCRSSIWHCDISTQEVELLRQLPVCTGAFFTSDGQWIAIGTEHELLLLELASPFTQVNSIEPGLYVRKVVPRAKGDQIAFLGYNQEIAIANSIPEIKSARRLEVHEDYWELDWRSPSTFACCSYTTNIHEWDLGPLPERNPRTFLSPHATSNYSFSQDGRYLITGCDNGGTLSAITAWEFDEMVHSTDVHQHEWFKHPFGLTQVWPDGSMEFETDGEPYFPIVTFIPGSTRFLASVWGVGGQPTGVIMEWDVALPAGPSRLVASGLSFGSSFSINPAGTIVVMARQNTMVAQALGSNETVRLKVPDSIYGFDNISFDQSGKKLAATTLGKLIVWSDLALEPTTVDLRIAEHPRAVAFDPRGELLAVGVGSEIRVWTLTEDNGYVERARLQDHQAEVRDIEFFHSGSVMATCAMDDTVRLWKVGDWKARPIVLQSDNERGVEALAISPSDDYLVAGGGGMTQLWMLNRDHVVSAVGKLPSRGLTVREASLYLGES